MENKRSAARRGYLRLTSRMNVMERAYLLRCAKYRAPLSEVPPDLGEALGVLLVGDIDGAIARLSVLAALRAFEAATISGTSGWVMAFGAGLMMSALSWKARLVPESLTREPS